jgi:hypothetical protein
MSDSDLVSELPIEKFCYRQMIYLSSKVVGNSVEQWMPEAIFIACFWLHAITGTLGQCHEGRLKVEFFFGETT